MSSENVELVKTVQPAEADLVEVFLAGSPDVSDSYAAEDSRFAEDFHVEFISATPGVARPTYDGLEGFLAGWRDWLEPYSSYHMTVEEYIDGGDQIVVLVKVRAKTSRDGVALEHLPAAVWTIADGKLAAVRLYLDREDAFRGAGMPSR